MAIVLDGTTGITTPELDSSGPVTSNGVTTSLYPLVSGTAVASTSGTSIDFTGIPSWVKRITVMFSGVSTNGTSTPLVQLGDSGGVENSGYSAVAFYSTGDLTSTAGFVIPSGNAANIVNGSVVFTLVTGNTWTACGAVYFATVGAGIAGAKTLSGTLDRVRITTANGTDTFDAGSINIMYE